MYRFPGTVPRKKQYQLLGNGVNTHVVATLLSYLLRGSLLPLPTGD